MAIFTHSLSGYTDIKPQNKQMQKSSAGLKLASHYIFLQPATKTCKKHRNVCLFWGAETCVTHLYAHSGMSHVDLTESTVQFEWSSCAAKLLQ